MATELMHTVEDFERIGDHGMNLLEVAEYNKEQEIEFSKDGMMGLGFLRQAVSEAIEITVGATSKRKRALTLIGVTFLTESQKNTKLCRYTISKMPGSG